MDNGYEAADAAAAGRVVREEDSPGAATNLSDAAEVMMTPRSEIVDIGTPDATTPVMRGGTPKDQFGEEADVFEEAVEAPRGDLAEEDTGAVGGVYDDGQGGADKEQDPTVSIDDGGSQEWPSEAVLVSQAEEQQQALGGDGSAAGGFPAVPNSGEVIGGYDDKGPGPERSPQQADEIPVVDIGDGAVEEEEEEEEEAAASVPVVESGMEYNDRDMLNPDDIQDSGNYELYMADTPYDEDGTLENALNDGDGEVLLPPEPVIPLGTEGLVPPITEDRALQSEDPSVELETGSDRQRLMSESLEDANFNAQDEAHTGLRGVPDVADEAMNQSDDEGEVVDATPPRSNGNLISLNSASVSDAADQPVYDDGSGFVQTQEEQKPGKVAADDTSEVIESVPKLNNMPSVDDDEDEVESSPVQPPPPVQEEKKASAVSQSHPSGLGSSAPLPEPTARAVQQQPRVNGSMSHRQAQPSDEAVNGGEVEEYDETREKLQMIRVKFLRLARRLGQTTHNVVVAQVLYRLGLAEQLRGSMNTSSRAGAFSFERASAVAEQLEAAGQEPLDFCCTIMMIGKTGVGKSATINSIFDEVRLQTDAFQLGTKKVQEIVGTVEGIKVRVIDTPGLFPSLSDQARNEKVLRSVKSFIKKNPPDVIMYLDRLDVQNRDMGDVPLLRTITNIFGPSIWFNAVVVLTHAASAPPDSATGPLSYELYVTQRTHVIQNAIRQAAGDPRLLNPVSLVENHSACRMNRAGQRVLPNGQVWKPHLLLLSFASKILTEANMLLKLQEAPTGRPFGGRQRSPPLPFFLSSLLQSRPQLKLPNEQFDEEDAADVDADEESESDDEPDYDDLPPFKRLTKEQISRLSKAQKKAYLDEIDYRERLFYKKQLKEEKKRRTLLKKMAAEGRNTPEEYNNSNIEDESSAPATVPVAMPDMTLPASFDSDYPSHRYRFLDTATEWIVRPVLETQGWDHDIGYEGLNIERMFVVKDKIPVSFSGQMTKDKKECTLQMELASSVKHGDGKATSLGLDMQSIGKDMAYTLRGETRFANFRQNTATAGISTTVLGDTVSAGVKIEDKLTWGKRFKMLVTGGAMTGRGDVAYGGRLEATLRDKDYPIGRLLSTLALSVVDWHGDLVLGCNLQSQIPVGRSTNMTAHASVNNRGTGQVGIRVNSTEQLLLALAALVPFLGNARKYIFGPSESFE